MTLSGDLGFAALDPAHVVMLSPAGALTSTELKNLVVSRAFDPPGTFAVSMASPVHLVRTLFALDGTASEILLLSPTLGLPHIRQLLSSFPGMVLVSDRDDVGQCVRPDELVAPSSPGTRPAVETSWIMTTSGTTGVPKAVRHTLQGLSRTVRRADPSRNATPAIWGLLYEPSRFAGMQVVLQAVLGGATLAVPSADDRIDARIDFLTAAGCTHLSATPTMWRSILMTQASRHLHLRQITLGGEIADEVVLKALGERFPQARLTHIYASTEAGVGFAVKDGKAGFPASYLTDPPSGVSIRIDGGELLLKPLQAGMAPPGGTQTDSNGHYRTGDRVEQVGDRVMFRGRDDFRANIGGAKVQLEDVERIVLDHPDVSFARAEAMRSSIAGNLLSLSVVAARPDLDPAELKRSVMRFCREHLPPEARPAHVRLLAEVPLEASGKTMRKMS